MCIIDYYKIVLIKFQINNIKNNNCLFIFLTFNNFRSYRLKYAVGFCYISELIQTNDQ